MNNWCGHKKTLIGTEHCPLKHNFREAVIDDTIAPDDQLVWCKRHCPTGALNCEGHEIYCLYMQYTGSQFRPEPEEGVKFREFITNGGNLDDWCNRKTAEEASLRRELTPGGHIVTIRRKP